jgi:hypothetical protein
MFLQKEMSEEWQNNKKLQITFGQEQVQISYTQCKPWALIDDVQELQPAYL